MQEKVDGPSQSTTRTPGKTKVRHRTKSRMRLLYGTEKKQANQGSSPGEEFQNTSRKSYHTLKYTNRVPVLKKAIEGYREGIAAKHVRFRYGFCPKTNNPNSSRQSTQIDHRLREGRAILGSEPSDFLVPMRNCLYNNGKLAGLFPNPKTPLLSKM